MVVDCGCSNHMCGARDLFNVLDETQKQIDRLGDDKLIKVESMRFVALDVQDEETKLLHVVQYDPGLAHNLISVGQLISKGYSILFVGEHCIIKINATRIENIRRTINNIFPMNVTSFGRVNLVVKSMQATILWQMRYGHICSKNLSLNIWRN